MTTKERIDRLEGAVNALAFLETRLAAIPRALPRAGRDPG